MSTKDAVLLGSSSAAATLCPEVSTGPPATTAVNSNAAAAPNNNKKILHQKRWVCDVCKVKWFLDFNEACAHEEQCNGRHATLSSTFSSSNAVAKKAAASSDCAVSQKSVMSSEKDGASPTITPPPQSKKAAAILAAARARARARARGQPVVDEVKQKKKSVDIEILSDGSDDNNNAMNEVKLVGGGSPPDSSSRRKSKRLRDATPPAKSNHDCSSSSNEMNGTKKPKAVAKTNKPTANNKSTTTSLKKIEKKGGGPIASIFLPKSQQQQQQQQQRKNDTNNNNSKKRAVETKVVPSKKRNEKSTKSTSTAAANKREVLEIDSSSDDDNDDDDGEVVVVVQKPNKKTKKNAVLGLSKKELAEHQAADFFARRKKKAEEERERQRKRDEARMARLNSKKAVSSKSLCVDLVGGVDSNVVVASSSSSKATAAAAGATVTKKISFLQPASESSKDTKTIPAPRFPCPSHIIPCAGHSDQSPADAFSSVLSKTPKFPHFKPMMTASPDEDDHATMPMGFLDKSDLINSESSIFSSFFDCSAIRKKTDEPPASASQLWVDKYTMRKIPDDVIGEDNKEASKKLIEFVEEWKVRRHKAMQSMGQVKRKKKRRKKKKSSHHGYDSDDSFLDEGGLENVFLISGPTGSGKTRLVHAAAEQCECVVIEINTTEQRSGQALKRAVQETTQSHSSLAMSKRKPGATGFFDNGRGDLVDSESDRWDSDSDDEAKEDGHSLTIILIDEGEFDCDICHLLFLRRCDVIVALNA
jgi:hypothetical protein